MNYFLGTGRYNVDPEWDEIWRNNTKSIIAREFACITIAGGRSWLPNEVTMDGNLGHVHDLLDGKKPHEFCGWSAAVCALAMMAYCSEYDFIYKEQDCLAFGPWVQQMYADMGDGDMVFGAKMKGPPWMQCGQSLFLIRHKFIPVFVTNYLSMGKDGDVNNLPERKFERLEQKFGKNVIKRLSFGYDRERPINFDDKVWYAQKFTTAELAELKKRGMI